MNRRAFLGATAAVLAAQGTRAQETAGTYVLVHGAMHGAWCWYKVIPRLQAAGAKVVAIDLPGRGRNPLPRSEHTRETFVAAITAAIDAAAEPVILVGHDVSGLLISLAAEARAERVSRLIYVAAYVPRDGDSLLALAQRDDESLAPRRSVASRDRSMVSLREDALREVLYADCSEEDIALAQLSLIPESTQPYTAPLHLSLEHYGKVPKAAIVCAQDRALGPRLQREMSESNACQPVLTMQCGHAPFFAMPDALVAALLAVNSG